MSDGQKNNQQLSLDNSVIICNYSNKKILNIPSHSSCEKYASSSLQTK